MQIKTEPVKNSYLLGTDSSPIRVQVDILKDSNEDFLIFKTKRNLPELEKDFYDGVVLRYEGAGNDKSVSMSIKHLKKILELYDAQ